MRRKKYRIWTQVRRLLNGQSGAVSVMVMICLSVLLFAQAVLLELGKVWVAEREAEQALKAAVRSALSAYDPKLQRYGLYGVSDHQAEEAFQEVLAANLSPLQAAAFWAAPPVEVKEASIQFGRSLADKDIFEAQLLEEMKVRAPVEYILRMMEPWLDEGVADQLNHGSQLRSSLQQLESLIERREDALDEAADPLRQMLAPQGGSGPVYQKLTANLGELQELAEQIGLLDLELIRKEIRSLEDELASLEADRNQLQQHIHLLALSMQGGPNPGAVEAINQLSERLAGLNERIHSMSRRLKELGLQLKLLVRYWALIGEVEAQLDVHYVWLTERKDKAIAHLDEARNFNEQIRLKAEEAEEAAEQSVSVYPGSFFTDTDIGVAGAVGQFGALRSSFLTMELVTGRDFVNIHSRLVRLTDAWWNKSTEEWNKWHAFDQQRKQQQAVVESRKQAERERAEGALSQLQALLYDCSGDAQESYAQVVSYQQLYSGQEKGAEPEETSLDQAEADVMGSKAFSLADQMTGALRGARDKAYVSEYVLNKLTYRTYDGQSHEKAHQHAHLLEKEEAEYVLYGLGSCAANQSAAFTEMYLIRLAIRTVEALTDPNRQVLSFMSPWLTFLWALAEGAVEALADMKKLVQGEQVELSAKLPKALSFEYKDYLRLFLLLHPQTEQRIARIQAVVHANTGRDLHAFYTYTEAGLRGRVPMLLLPNHIAIRKEAAWSY